MASDANLSALLEIARRELSDVPDDVWRRFERIARTNFGTHTLYVEAQTRQRRLEALSDADTAIDAAKLAQMLGVSVRHARRLKKAK